MDSNESVEPRDDADQANQANQADQGKTADDGTAVDLPSATIIGANILANNTAPFPGGVAAPAAEIAAEEAADEGVGPLDLDALEKFGSKGKESAGEGVSTDQSELEADEPNG